MAKFNFLWTFIFSFMACTNATNDVSKEVFFEAVNHLNDCEIKVKDDLDEDEYLIINSIGELEKHLNLEELADTEQCIELTEELNIDFEKYTLLIGKQRLSAIEGSLLSQEFVKVDKEKYVYRVRIENGGYTAIGQFRFGVIISKISPSAELIFDVEVLESEN